MSSQQSAFSIQPKKNRRRFPLMDADEKSVAANFANEREFRRIWVVEYLGNKNRETRTESCLIRFA